MSTYDVILERVERAIALLGALETAQDQESIKLLQECLEAIRS